MDPDSDPAAPPGTVAVHRRGNDVELEVELSPAADLDDAATGALRRQLVTAVGAPRLAGARVHLAVELPTAGPWEIMDEIATDVGFGDRRDLLQLRRPLPVPTDHPTRSSPPLATRAWAAGTSDEDAWLRVNNRAFATHPDQGNETSETLRDRTAQDWFDPEGFLVLDDPDRPGELAGFCWTKLHPATEVDPPLGEIYVIGVDPRHRGEGLGARLVLAGLDHLAAVGLSTANLYVDGDNAPATSLYDRLGFTVHTRRRVYTPADLQP